MASLVLVMIARDEERAIARCLASVRPWVDRMLVLDTGSLDATPRLAREAGAEVLPFDWIDDFAAARNHALERAAADWSLILDADEWLADGGPALAALRDAEPAFVGQLQVASSFDAGDGVAVAPSWLARVLPRGARFAGRIHEQVVGAWPRRRLAVTLGHDGYLPAQQQGKRGRNERLLRLALAERPDDAYLHYQLGKDLELADRFAAALPHYEQALARGAADDPWRHDLALRLVYVLKCARQWERAIAVGDAEFARWPESPDTFFVLGDLLLDWALAEPARAAELLPMIEASWQRCLALGERTELEGAVRGRGSFLAAHNLAAFHTGLGQEASAAHYRRMADALRAPAAR